MKDSERRLLLVFFVIAALMGGAILSQRLLQWDHRLDRMTRDMELSQMESDALIAQAPYWKASSEWIQRTQPVAASGYDAGNNLHETLERAAKGAGFEIQKTDVEPVVETGYYRQHGVTLTVKGDLAKILEWIHATLVPSDFYVVPRLKIMPDKTEKSQDVIATISFQRRYTPEFASASGSSATPSHTQAPSLSPGITPVPVPVPAAVPVPAPAAPEVGNP